MVLLFCCVNISIASSIKDVKANNQRAALELVDLSNKQDELEAEEETVGTDAFVEQQARDVYDFMMPDELFEAVNDCRGNVDGVLETESPCVD